MARNTGTARKGNDMATKENDAPKFCPFCGSGAKLVKILEWEARNLDDRRNNCFVDEYQCHGDCEGKSFWA
jgi:hypothetical protein